MANRNLYNRYARNLKGFNAVGFFTGAAAYPSDTEPLSTFIATATDGDIAIFLNASDTVEAGALGAGVDFYIAQRNSDDNIKKSQVVNFDNIRRSVRTDYSAPTAQVTFVGYDGTATPTPISAATISLPTTVSDPPLEYAVQVQDLSTANQPFPITEGRTVISKANALIYDDLLRPIVNDMNDVPDYEGNSDDGFVYVDLVNDEAGTVLTANTTTFTLVQGSTHVVLGADDPSGEYAVGDFLGFDVAGSGGELSWFKITAEDGGNSVTLDRPWPFAGETITGTAITDVSVGGAAALEAGDWGIRCTSIVETVFFTVGIRDDLALAGVGITTGTAWAQGSGASWQVHFMEEECAVQGGYTVLNAPFTQDYGQPDFYVPFDGADTYDIYYLDYINSTQSAAPPLAATTQYDKIVIGVRNDTPGTPGGTVATALDTVLGL